MQRDGIDVIVGFPNSHMFDSFQASTRYLTGIGGNCASVGVVFPLCGDVTAIVSPDQDPAYLRAVQDWVARHPQHRAGLGVRTAVPRALG